jgi:SAM-dependent methyltransferase
MPTKDVQGKLWNTAPANWARYIEPTFVPMYQKVLDRLALNEEKRLLDAGCGSGLFLSMAAASGAQLHGIDASQGLLALSRQRVPGAYLRVEDLEALPFIDGTFDVVTGFNSFPYAHSFEGALAEARRVVKRHGKVVIGIWGREEECNSGSVLKAVMGLLPPPPQDAPGLFSLSEEGKLEAICHVVGLRVISRQTAFCPVSFNSDQALQEGFLCTATCAGAVESIGEEAVRNMIIESAEPYNLADDVYYLHNHFTILITEKI